VKAPPLTSVSSDIDIDIDIDTDTDADAAIIGAGSATASSASRDLVRGSCIHSIEIPAECEKNQALSERRDITANKQRGSSAEEARFCVGQAVRLSDRSASSKWRSSDSIAFAAIP